MFLNDLEAVPKVQQPITLHCDAKGTVANANRTKKPLARKHIERKYHLTSEIVQREDMTMCQIASGQSVAYPFTKTLAAKVYEGNLNSLG